MIIRNEPGRHIRRHDAREPQFDGTPAQAVGRRTKCLNGRWHLVPEACSIERCRYWLSEIQYRLWAVRTKSWFSTSAIDASERLSANLLSARTSGLAPFLRTAHTPSRPRT